MPCFPRYTNFGGSIFQASHFRISCNLDQDLFMSRLNFEAHQSVGVISQRDSIFKLPRNCLSMMDLDPKACMQYVDD